MSSSTTSHSASLTNHKASVYRKNANFVYSDKFTDPLFDLLDAKPGQRIVDLGCGSGELTVKLGELVGSEGLVVGIDSSPDMVCVALCLFNLIGSHLVTCSSRKPRN